MRNMILLIVSVFFVIVFGGLTISWFIQAHQMKKAVEKAIGDINHGVPYLGYNSIEASGYPWSINISVVKPRFTGRFDNFLRQALSNGNTDMAKTLLPKMRGWDEDAVLDGRITFGVNMFSDRYTLSAEGKWRSTSMIDNNLLTFDGNSTGDMGCSLKLERRDNFLTSLWNVASLQDEDRDIAGELRSLECMNEGFSITEMGFNDILYSHGPQHLLVTQDVTDKHRKLHFLLNSKDVELSPRGNTFVFFYMQAFNGVDIIPPRISESGKQNVDIDFDYDGPLELKDLTTEAINVSLNKAHMQSNVGTLDALFKYSVKPNGDDRSVFFNTSLVAIPNKGYDNYITNRFRDIAHNLFISSDERLAKARSKLSKYTEDEGFELIKPVVPTMEALGKFSQNIVASYEGKNDLSEGNLNLDEFEIGTDPYGITAKGNLRMASKKMPEPHVKITCRNCLQMIDDASAYARKVVQTYNYFESENIQPPIADIHKVNGLKSFLTDLATPPKSSIGADLVYIIAGDGSPNITVNGKSLEEVNKLYSTYLPPSTTPPAAKP